MKKTSKELMIKTAQRLYNQIDFALQKEHAKEWFGKNAVILRNARENLDFVILNLDKLQSEKDSQ